MLPTGSTITREVNRDVFSFHVIFLKILNTIIDFSVFYDFVDALLFLIPISLEHGVEPQATARKLATPYVHGYMVRHLLDGRSKIS